MPPWSATGTTRVELGGASDFGLITASNTDFQGTLEIVRVNGFTPTVGQEFEIITYISQVGSFSPVNGTDIGNASPVATFR